MSLNPFLTNKYHSNTIERYLGYYGQGYFNGILLIFLFLVPFNYIQWYLKLPLNPTPHVVLLKYHSIQWYSMVCLGSLFKEIIVPLYEVFQDDMPGALRQLQHEVGRRKARWDTMNVAERHSTTRFKKSTPTDMCTAVVILMVMSVSTVTADRALFQRNAASRQLYALYTDNCAHVGAGLDARPQEHRVGC